jgi:hypothetical protein
MAGVFLIMCLASYTTIIFSLGINLLGAVMYYCYRGSFSDLCCKYSKLKNRTDFTEEVPGPDTEEEQATNPII